MHKDIKRNEMEGCFVAVDKVVSKKQSDNEDRSFINTYIPLTTTTINKVIDLASVVLLSMPLVTMNQHQQQKQTSDDNSENMKMNAFHPMNEKYGDACEWRGVNDNGKRDLSMYEQSMMVSQSSKQMKRQQSPISTSSMLSSSATSTKSSFSFYPRMLVLENPNEFLNEEDQSAILADCFSRMADEGNELLARTGAVQRDLFSGSSVPQISILDYIKRMMKYLTGIARGEFETGRDLYIVNDMAVRYMVMAIIYLERIKSKSKFIILSKNIHRLIITAITVASKIADDFQPKNSYFAKLGGIPTNELNLLENEFCSLIDFHLHIDPEEFKSCYESIVVVQQNRLNHTWSMSQDDMSDVSCSSSNASSPITSIAAAAA